MKSPFNYTGSKSDLYPQLSKYFPKSDTLIDLFCGGGGFFVNAINNFKNIYANDIITPLIEFYKYIQNENWETVITTVKSRNISKDKEQYLALRDRFNQNKDFIDFFILVCSCTNNMMRFNKQFKFNQTHGKRNFNPRTEDRLLEYHKVIYKSNIKFTNQSFDMFDNINKGDFIYLDPPYIMSEAGYNAFWSKTLEEKLFNFIDELDKNGIYFMLSNVLEHKGKINDNISKLSRYNLINLEYNYDKVSRDGNPESKEIIIVNY